MILCERLHHNSHRVESARQRRLPGQGACPSGGIAEKLLISWRREFRYPYQRVSQSCYAQDSRASTNIQWYCPPAVGAIEDISAKETTMVEYPANVQTYSHTNPPKPPLISPEDVATRTYSQVLEKTIAKPSVARKRKLRLYTCTFPRRLMSSWSLLRAQRTALGSPVQSVTDSGSKYRTASLSAISFIVKPFFSWS